MMSLWDAGGVLSGQTRVPAQMVHNVWSDHWIVLKFLKEFPENVFLGVAIKLLLDTASVWSGHNKHQARLPALEVRNTWSDRWSSFNFYRSFKRLVSLASQWNRHDTPLVYSQATPECLLKRYITLDPTVGSFSNFYRSFKRLVSLASQWNFLETMVVSCRTRLEYRLKRSITLDLTVGSCSKFYMSFWRRFSLASH